VRVLVVADDMLVRAGLAALLSGQPDVTVDQAAPEVDLGDVTDAHACDIILWDLGTGAARSDARLPAMQDLDTPVVVLSDDDARVSDAMTAGARGALPRDIDGPALLAALRAVVLGLMAIDPAFAPAIVQGRGAAPEVPAEELTPRELQVLQLLAEGLPNKRVALQLGISEHTVKFHVAVIFSKLGAHGRTEAVTRAARLGLIVL